MTRIEVYDNFFEPTDLSNLLALIAGVRWQHGWKSSRELPNYVQFNADFTHTSARYNEDAASKIAPDIAPTLLRAWDVIQTKAIRERHALLRCYANLSRYGIDGMPHRDTPQENDTHLTCLLYCVRGAWPLEWGGETVICRNHDIIRSVIPRENRLLLFTSSVLHIARGVTRVCFEERVTLMWKSKPTTH